MNIVHILGNGFDLNLGLRTSYQNFYEDYLEQNDADMPSVVKLKKFIGSNIETWADLELSLGAYSKHLHTTEEVDEVFFDICEKLSDYLNTEETRISRSDVKIAKFYSDALAPESYLTLREQRDFNAWVDNARQRNAAPPAPKLNVLTFNYTRTLKRILGDGEAIKNDLSANSKNASFDKISHIHGQLGETLIMGVNDRSQIANDELHDSEEAMEVCIKPDHNQSLGHMSDEHCFNIISRANLIVIFGSSIGQTDKLWWGKIGERLLKDCLLLIFVRSKDIPASRLVTTNRIKREIADDFLRKTRLSEEQRATAKNRIYVGVNQSIFDMKKLSS